MKPDGIALLRHLLQVWAFALVIATLQYAFMPDRPYGPPVAYSLLISTLAWAIIDLGRRFMPSAAETGWPPGWAGVLLVLVGVTVGYLLGTWLADQLCRHYGWYLAGDGANTATPLRTSILITALAGVVVSYYFYSANKGAYLERKMREARQHATEARLKLLEAQLEPHMLFNTLANLRALISTDAARAQTMLDHMIAYLRATLAASRNSTHTLQAEFDRLHDYLALMGIRMGPRLSCSLDLPAPLAALPVPALLLQPLVENSIQHGLEPQVEGGSIRVSARQEGPDLVLDVVDTGVGLASPANATHATSGPGFGVAQVRERLATVYGNRASVLLCTEADGGTRATLRLPLQQ